MSMSDIRRRLLAGEIDEAEAGRLLRESQKPRGRPPNDRLKIIDKRRFDLHIGREYQNSLDSQTGRGAKSQRRVRDDIRRKWKIQDSRADKCLRSWRSWVSVKIWVNHITPFDPQFPREWLGVYKWTILQMEAQGVFERQNKISESQ